MANKGLKISDEQLLLDNEDLRSRLKDAEDALSAIRNGEVDAIIVSGNDGEKVFSLTSAETPYRTIVEKMNEGAVSVNSDGIILYCNPVYAALISRPIEKIIGSSCFQYVEKNERHKFKRTFKKSLKGNANGDFTCISHDNKTIHVNLSFNSLSTDKNTDVCIIASDITKKKKYQKHLESLVKERTSAIESANEKLKEYIIELERAKEDSSQAWINALRDKNRLEIIMETLPVGVAIMNLQGEITSYNNLFEKIWGGRGPYIKNEESYSRFNARWVETNKLVQLHEWASSIAIQKGKSKLNQQIIKKSLNNKNIYILNSAAPIFDKNGEIDGCVVVIQDITILKTTEYDLINAQNRLNVALEKGNIGIWEWNVKTNEMFWDKRMRKIFGLDTDLPLQSYSTFESFINEEDLAHFRKELNIALESDLQFETVIRTKPVNGSSNYISVKATVNKDKNDKPVSLTGVGFDVTDMKKDTEQVLIKLNEELLRSNKDLEQFAYVASHDLQEPLRMVTFFTQRLAENYKDKLDQDANEYIKYAVDGSKRMYDLINGLLAYSRVHAKGKEYTLVNMNNVIEKVTDNLNLKIKEKKVVLKIKKLPVIYADESQMMQLMQNLVANAIKFSKEFPTITIGFDQDPENYIFSVKDKGIGIEPQYFEKIFKIFQRLVRADEYEGIGVGLAICKRIVERHNGKIWVKSELGQGTTFYFSIHK